MSGSINTAEWFRLLLDESQKAALARTLTVVLDTKLLIFTPEERSGLNTILDKLTSEPLPYFTDTSSFSENIDKMMDISSKLGNQQSTRFERIFAAALTGLCSGMNFADGEEYRITRTVAEAINIANTAEQLRKEW